MSENANSFVVLIPLFSRLSEGGCPTPSHLSHPPTIILLFRCTLVYSMCRPAIRNPRSSKPRPTTCFASLTPILVTWTKPSTPSLRAPVTCSPIHKPEPRGRQLNFGEYFLFLGLLPAPAKTRTRGRDRILSYSRCPILPHFHHIDPTIASRFRHACSFHPAIYFHQPLRPPRKGEYIDSILCQSSHFPIARPPRVPILIPKPRVHLNPLLGTPVYVHEWRYRANPIS